MFTSASVDAPTSSLPPSQLLESAMTSLIAATSSISPASCNVSLSPLQVQSGESVIVTNMVEMAVPMTFHPFKKLPIELRLKIWGLSTPNGHESGGRIIEVLQKKSNNKAKDTKLGEFYTNATIPALLHVCHESRMESLKVYKLLTIDHNNANSAALQLLSKAYQQLYRFNQPSRDLSVDYVPKNVKFNTYIDYKKDVIYMVSSHLVFHSSTSYWDRTMQHAGAPVVRFLEALSEHPDACHELKNIGFRQHKDFIPGEGNEWEVEDRICKQLLNFKGLENVNLSVVEECCTHYGQQSETPVFGDLHNLSRIKGVTIMEPPIPGALLVVDRYPSPAVRDARRRELEEKYNEIVDELPLMTRKSGKGLSNPRFVSIDVHRETSFADRLMKDVMNPVQYGQLMRLGIKVDE